ncbi:MAG: PTS sugar transporter subunit IIA [Planctomycetota bacterium]
MGLNLTDYCALERVTFLEATDKASALEEMVELLVTDPRAGERDPLIQAILARDEIVSTAIGFGIAIPHARIESVKRLCMAVGLSPGGIDYPSIDDKPVRVVVMIAASSEDQNLYLRVLSKVMAFLKRERENLMKCTTPEEAFALLQAH